MDQKTTSSGSDSGSKKNWRERLGINKDLPKIAADFKEERRPPAPPPPLRPTMPPAAGATGRPALKPGQQVARPAPMAPRSTRTDPPVLSGARAGAAPRPPATARASAATGPTRVGGPARAPAPARVVAPPVAPPPAPIVRNIPAAAATLPAPADDSKPAQAAPESPAVSAEEKPVPVTAGTPVPAGDEKPAAAPDDFSARLRAQREAAERLAEQRLKSARLQPKVAVVEPVVELVVEPETVEADTAPVDGQQPVAEAAEETPTDAAAEVPAGATDEVAAEEKPTARPKFGFAPEELKKPDTDQSPPVVAPLAPAAAIVTPAASAATAAAMPMPNAHPQRQPGPPPQRPAQGYQERATVPNGYPSQTDQPAAMPPPGMRQAMPMPQGYPPAGQQQSAMPGGPAAAGAPPPLRAPVQPGQAVYNQRGVHPGYAQAASPAPAAGRAGYQQAPGREAPGRPLDYVDDDLSGVFEDEARSAKAPARASAEDYNAAYRDFDEAFEDQGPRRSSGPIILILALLTVAAIAGALVYFYRTTTTTATTPATVSEPAGKADGQLPKIPAPEQPIKEQPAETPATATQPSGRKQIYDRILGEQTLEQETILPSEEAPQLPSATQGDSEGGVETEPLPLPLPPPPGSEQQGLLPGDGNQTTARSDQTAPSDSVAKTDAEQGAQSGQGVVISQSSSEPAAGGVVNSDPTRTGELLANLPLPEPPLPGASDPVAQEVAAPVPEPVVVANTSPPPKPRRKPFRRLAAAAPQPAPAPEIAQFTTPPATGSGPTLIAPVPATPQTQAIQPTQPALPLPDFLKQAQSGTATQAPRRKTGAKLSDDDPLADARNAFSSSTPAATAPQQVTALQQPAPVPQAPASTGPGYVVQLASFRSEADALGEFQRLRSRHGNLIGGLSSRVQKADLGTQGTFYRLGIGPLGDKSSAKKLCNSLIAAGEKDCLVRRQ